MFLNTFFMFCFFIHVQIMLRKLVGSPIGGNLLDVLQLTVRCSHLTECGDIKVTSGIRENQELPLVIFRVLPGLTVLPVRETNILRDLIRNPRCIIGLGDRKTPASPAAITARTIINLIFI